MLIDMHVHIFPDFLAPKALNRLEQTNRRSCVTDATLDDTLRLMKECGVDHFTALNIATKPTQQNSINHWASSIQNDHIHCFGSVHPDAQDALEELEQIHQLGLPGIKLHPDYQNTFVDDPKLFPIYDLASQLGLLVTVHAGRDPLSPNVVHAPPHSIATVIGMFPKLKLTAAHMGGMIMYREVEEYLVGKNIYFDTAMAAQFCPKEEFVRLVSLHGSERILFASDCPWSSPSSQFDFIESAGLSSKEKENIYWKNAARLLNLTL